MFVQALPHKELGKRARASATVDTTPKQSYFPNRELSIHCLDRLKLKKLNLVSFFQCAPKLHWCTSAVLAPKLEMVRFSLGSHHKYDVLGFSAMAGTFDSTHSLMIDIEASNTALHCFTRSDSFKASPCGIPRGHSCDRVARPDRETAKEKEAQGVANITAPIRCCLICLRSHDKK